MKWSVNSENSRRGPIYYVEKGGEKKTIMFDCERSAQTFADFLNRKDEESRNEAQNRRK